MRLNPLPSSEYDDRVARLQKELNKNGIDLFISYSSECESASSRYLTGFWPFFDFAVVIVPAEGKAALLTGGPESYEFAKEFSSVPLIFINPLLVETCAPEWVPKVDEMNFSEIISKVCKKNPKKIGIGNWNIFPYVLFKELNKAVPDAQFSRADNLLLNVQKIKSKDEIPYIIEAYHISEEAMKTALNAVKPGMKEWEVEAIARTKMLSMGAEGMPYPSWVCSGDHTRLSLCRSTDKPIEKNELIQFTFGAKYMGYCGNMCRPFSIGKVPKSAKALMEVALEAFQYALDNIKPGIIASSIFDGYYKILSNYGYENFTLYGPAHGTGHSEVEGFWLAENADFIIEPGMLFNIDIWLSDGINGLRYEDGILITDKGIKELTSYKREIIEL
ncbi:MAG: Xaa-Pro peptidase family protein [Actinobacteria bacterium]|nr:Xaa-Pro peptidase family protein [Cyanobacteriota bacterium]MCL5771630.1 Xaa-Pro peptidase family protein [Actinomycetota bacterium]